jgi:hypothetical protein
VARSLRASNTRHSSSAASRLRAIGVRAREPFVPSYGSQLESSADGRIVGRCDGRSCSIWSRSGSSCVIVRSYRFLFRGRTRGRPLRDEETLSSDRRKSRPTPNAPPPPIAGDNPLPAALGVADVEHDRRASQQGRLAAAERFAAADWIRSRLGAWAAHEALPGALPESERGAVARRAELARIGRVAIRSVTSSPNRWCRPPANEPLARVVAPPPARRCVRAGRIEASRANKGHSRQHRRRRNRRIRPDPRSCCSSRPKHRRCAGRCSCSRPHCTLGALLDLNPARSAHTFPSARAVLPPLNPTAPVEAATGAPALHPPHY